MAAAASFIDARRPPTRRSDARSWLRENLFSSVASAVATLLFAALLAWLAALAIGWGLVHAVWIADADQCQAARGVGACWGVIAEKGRLILLGRYPAGESWRPVTATVLLLGLVGASCNRRLWTRWLALLWPAVSVLFLWLMGGGAGLSRVATDLWGGLPLTVMLTVASLVLAFPLAIVVALGRRSTMPALRTLCIAYVEVVRGVPLISVLFMASFMFPLFVPPGHSPDVLVRVVVGITLFAAAYMAEIVRGGLQSVPRGQIEAAASIGLTWWQAQRKIVLPQALAAVVPAIMNNFISLFKDTSLVTIVSLYELTGALSLALDSDPNWRPFKIEGYLFIAAIYFAFCFAMSRYSLRVERRLARSHAR
jgi:general L-amino acid transport system permease protein